MSQKDSQFKPHNRIRPTLNYPRDNPFRIPSVGVSEDFVSHCSSSLNAPKKHPHEKGGRTESGSTAQLYPPLLRGLT